jgi:choline kinase
MARIAVILAAGRGSRLDPGGATEEFSKPLMEVGGKTLLSRTVECCRMAGIERVIVVTGFRAELVKAEADRLSNGDVETVHNADWQKSNGLSLYVCRDVIDEDFTLMMSDHIFDPSILSDLASLAPEAGSVTLAVDSNITEVFDLDDATKVRIDDGKIVDISKQLDDYNAIDCGLFLCTTGIFPALAEAMDDDGDCSLSDGMRIVGQRGLFVGFDIGPRWWQDVDTPDMLEEAIRLLERHAAA